ncbi:hypothetical protein [Pseudarthrobacter sulfonivorans]|uniref:hypothetical protein n=1 Tax=Pseudarthrobacter sulfonivorans TaxID=121292 RepID=UPI002781F180|nr:hypothetical protein [Pseudarthrobacter sulfonivorans]MDP9998757.1 hypothetical protein [Pseudarthrobacter sulfonivorans]
MPSLQGASAHHRAACRPGLCLSGKVPLRTRTRSAVALSTAGAVLAGAVLAGCEYSYDDGWRPALNDVSAAPRVTEPDVAAEQWQNEPVSAAGLEAWLETVQLGSGLQVAHRGYGLLQAKEVRTETVAGLPVGTYVLALVCRSQRPVTFTVSNEVYTMVHLSLRCGSKRQNVIYLAKETALTFRVEAQSEANYAYRLIWL